MAPVLPADADLVIVLPHLGAGGAQKVALLAASHFAAQGLRVVLVTLLPDKPPAHRLPPDLLWLDLGPEVAATWRDRALPARLRRFLKAWIRRLLAWGLLLTAWPLLKRWRPPSHAAWIHWLIVGASGPQAALLRQLFVDRPPRRVLSLLTRTNLLCCQALWDLPTHLVVSERNDPRLQAQPFPWRRLQRWLWHRADRITANTAGVLEGLRQLHPDLATLPTLLPNPLPRPATGAMPAPDLSDADHASCLLAVCRLVPQKGIDLLIRAYALLDAELQCSWPLRIAGDGPERADLEDLARRCTPGAPVRFLGFVEDPAPLFQPAALFVLPSRFEGMPNALLEAMAQGLAVIVSDASPGPLEVVEHGVSGWVVPSGDVEALAAAIRHLSGDAALRQRLGRAARQRIASHDWPCLEPIWRQALALDVALPLETGDG